MLLTLSNLFTKFQSYITAGLGAALLVTSAGWYITDLKLDAAVAGRKTDRALYEKAQSEYETKALKEKQETERINRERAAKADNDYNDLLSRYRASLVRYQAAQRQVSGDNLSRPAPTSEGSNGPSISPVLPDGSNTLIITYQDADICAVNTARLQAVHDWAVGLQD